MKAEAIINLLIEKGKTIAVAESCTGGLLSGTLTSIPGSSKCFGYGVVTYSNQAKHDLLGISWQVLNEFGAVSYETAVEMAKSVKKLARAQIGLSITGIAGPSGGSERKPVGLVYIGLAGEEFCSAHKFYFTGSREEIRNLSVDKSLDLILQYLAEL
ncbi:MAG: CinA family protein [Bacillota bacterium]|nr:CinA family protein [Clostridia bacterium]